MEGRDILAVALAAVLSVLAAALALQVSADVTDILIPSQTTLPSIVYLAAALLALAAGQAIAHALAEDRTLRLAAGVAGILPVLPLSALGATSLAHVSLLSASVSLAIFQFSRYEGLRGLWSFLGHMRGVGALLVFALVALAAYQNPEPFRQAFQKTLFAFALSQAQPGSMNLGEDIDRLVPDTPTQAELEHIRNAILAQYPNFYQLPPEVQRQIEQNFIDTYVQMKREIKAALKEAFSNVTPEKMAEALEKSVKEMPVFQTIMEYVGVLYALVASFVYSLAAYAASILAFLLALPIWPKGKRKEGG